MVANKKIKKEDKKSSLEDKNQATPPESQNILGTEYYGDILALWEFPEFIKQERGKLWYTSFSIVFIAMLVYAYFSDNLLFAIILVIFAVLYLSSSKDDPQTVETALTEEGIFVGAKFVPYENFQNFYIIYYPPQIKNLYFQPKNILKPRITIPLENQNPIHIREILLDYLDEDIKKEEIPASEGISRILKL